MNLRLLRMLRHRRQIVFGAVGLAGFALCGKPAQAVQLEGAPPVYVQFRVPNESLSAAPVLNTIDTDAIQEALAMALNEHFPFIGWTGANEPAADAVLYKISLETLPVRRRVAWQLVGSVVRPGTLHSPVLVAALEDQNCERLWARGLPGEEEELERAIIEKLKARFDFTLSPDDDAYCQLTKWGKESSNYYRAFEADLTSRVPLGTATVRDGEVDLTNPLFNALAFESESHLGMGSDGTLGTFGRVGFDAVHDRDDTAHTGDVHTGDCTLKNSYADNVIPGEENPWAKLARESVVLIYIAHYYGTELGDGARDKCLRRGTQ